MDLIQGCSSISTTTSSCWAPNMTSVLRSYSDSLKNSNSNNFLGKNEESGRADCAMAPGDR